MEMQSPVLVITPVKAQHKDALIAFLSEMNRKLWHESFNPFGTFDKQHFARWVVIGDQLLFGAAVDGTPEDYLAGLTNHCAELLSEVYYHCENFPQSNPPASESIYNYLLAHQATTQMFYHGLRNRTVRDVRLESQIHRSIEVFLDGNQDSNEFKAKKPHQILETIRAHLKGIGVNFDSESSFFGSSIAPVLKRKLWWRYGLLGAVLLMTLLLSPLILAKEWLEKKRPPDISPFVEDSSPRDLDFEEIQAIQSPMTSIVAIKPGLFRQATLRLTLWAIQILADYKFNKGSLGSINSIHFARWAIINNGRHLLFFSNYDGSWESYLGDFIDRAAIGLTAVWNNAVGFPPARFLIRGGASHAEEFKQYARRSQVVTHFWYSAYPNLSMANKVNNRAIRARLMNKSKESAAEWLQRF
ncbi:MAG: hypothetical protein R3208_20215 [Ketobacteraceae bacterium]|nr:hypothetical protein [Ketobacteraceae bacterium]